MFIIEDRLTRGFWAGVLAGIPTFFANLISHLLFDTKMFLYFDSIAVYGRPPENLIEKLFASFDTTLFIGFLGVIFSYLIPKVSSRNLIFKSWFFGKKVWFFIYAIAVMFKLPTITTVTFSNAFSNFVSASVWGISLGYVYRWLDQRAANEAIEMSHNSKVRFAPVPSPVRKIILRRNKK